MICYSQDKHENNVNNDKYRKILMELGAFPYLIERCEPFYIYAKGGRLRRDINGWISPYQSKYIKLTEEEKVKYAFPPTKEKILRWYNKYKSMLSIQEYSKCRDIQYQTIMYFLLEILIEEELPIENIQDLIELLKLKPGYEGMMVRLLQQKISLNQAIDIFYSIKDIIGEDFFLMDMLFPSICKEDIKAIKKINAYVNNKYNQVYFRWFFALKLYEMDKSFNREQFVEISTEEIFYEKDEFLRKRMYEIILEIGEKEINIQAYKFLEGDPDTLCRIQILGSLAKIGYIDNNILNVIEEISLGKGRYWHFYDRYLMKLEYSRYQDLLKGYLNYMIKKKVRNNKMLGKIENIYKNIDKIRPRKIEDMNCYFRYFKIKEKK